MSTIRGRNIPSSKRIAELCMDKFKTIPKNGKPIKSKEWTVLSCILIYDQNSNELDVVSLGSGKEKLNMENHISTY